MRAATDASLCGAPAARRGWLTEHARGAPAQHLPLFSSYEFGRKSPALLFELPCTFLATPFPHASHGASFLDEAGRGFGATPASSRPPCFFCLDSRFAPAGRQILLPLASQPKALTDTRDREEGTRGLFGAIKPAKSSWVSPDSRLRPLRRWRLRGFAFLSDPYAVCFAGRSGPVHVPGSASHFWIGALSEARALQSAGGRLACARGIRLRFEGVRSAKADQAESPGKFQ